MLRFSFCSTMWPSSLSAVKIHILAASGWSMLPARIARSRQRIIGRDSGMSNAFLAPPFGDGMCSTRSLRFRCSIFAVFRAVGRLPQRTVNR